MKNLTDKQLMNIDGGLNFGIVAGISAGVAFIIGILDGIIRPLKCR